MHLSTAHTWRGGENQILLLCKGLKSRGQKVLIIAPKDAPLHERAHEAGLETHVLGLREVDPAGTYRLARLLRKLRPDVLHLHDGHAVLPGQLAARALAAKKLSVFAHRRTAFKVRGRWKYGGRVDKVVAISEAVKEQVLAAGVAAEKVAVVYSGLDFPEVLAKDSPEAQALRAELHLGPQAVLAAHAAALTSEKRHVDLIAAVSRLHHGIKEGKGVKDGPAAGVHLAIAGTGELEQALKQQVQREGLDSKIHFLGFRRDLRPLWAAADLAVFASEAEGLCTALVEAQGAGLPAVVTRAGGMAEVVADGKTGALVPIGDVAALAEALGRLAANPQLRERQGQAARERARTLFSADAMADRILGLYREAGAAKDLRKT
ncbi:MAG: glycosyltransferase family 4 protein [Planctomycetes bacterium]|nr:glycosyltransferase family 4 protein [Planctomycetota bacterium]